MTAPCGVPSLKTLNPLLVSLRRTEVMQSVRKALNHAVYIHGVVSSVVAPVATSLQ